MVSLKQLEANRRNAQLSTGPLTAQGKERSSRNATKHGLTGKNTVIPGESPEEFEAFRANLFGEIEPESVLQAELVDRLAGIFWRLRRVPRFEQALLHSLQWRVRREQAQDCVPGYAQGDQSKRPAHPADHQLHPGRLKAEDAWLQATAELNADRGVLGSALIDDGSNALGKVARYEWTLMKAAERTLRQLSLLRTTSRPPRRLVELGLVDAVEAVDD